MTRTQDLSSITVVDCQDTIDDVIITANNFGAADAYVFTRITRFLIKEFL